MFFLPDDIQRCECLVVVWISKQIVRDMLIFKWPKFQINHLGEGLLASQTAFVCYFTNSLKILSFHPKTNTIDGIFKLPEAQAICSNSGVSLRDCERFDLTQTQIMLTHTTWNLICIRFYNAKSIRTTKFDWTWIALDEIQIRASVHRSLQKRNQ